MAGGAGRIGRGVAGRVYRGGAGRIYRASRISGNMPCRASERGFSDPDIARSTGKDGTAQASYSPAFKANLPIRILMLTFAPVSTGVDRHFHGTLSGEVPVSAVAETMCG